ncbi:hypothetical protein LTR56_001769 [Elasticomyces elasticus]|nr:hypothetical protein LTR56_001769 [Elasticomyces elasticus]KAK3668881.1 hypothetical protein LTR22_000361 [Elasticomyces elasticus]KAK4924997.1 hypothetical protein LTR49_008003 [Elasticomyces elasticus]KAK5717092.1 hypothetical protein LTR15_008981 [Elasticomyces elasticus]KAK5763254.1 hypothetical protein LTS12_006638 [Elasticomyces elasticus]
MAAEKMSTDAGTGSSNGLTQLLDQLDQLWVDYLTFLDQYQAAQGDIKKQLSAGHFSLTQANFKSPNRRPYGQDYYDNRMKASRGYKIAPHNQDSLSMRFKVIDMTDSAKSAESAESAEKDAASEPQQQPSPPSTPTPDGHEIPETPTPTAEDNKEKPGADATASHDPLRWFGILLPRELRSSQASFRSVIDGPVETAANAIRGMRETEAKISRLRKAVRKIEKAEG